MKTSSKIIVYLFLGGFLVAANHTVWASESWAVDPKTGCQIGWVSGTGSILVTATWSGSKAQGKAEGKGVLTFTLREKTGKEIHGRAEAEMVAGMLDGKVRLKWSTGETFEGSYKMGIREGRGVSRFPDGAIFDYEWRNGVKDGHAIVRKANGDSFEGEVRNNQFSKGLYKWADGSTYEGEWTDNRITGKGLRKWPNGQFYAGDFKNGLAHGKGTKKFLNGATYEGDFVDDRPAGHGVLKDPQGKLIFHGERKNLQDESMQQFGEAAKPLPASAPFAPIASPAATQATALAPPVAIDPALRTPPPTHDVNVSSDHALLRELRERLYELNFDPATEDMPFIDADRRAIREFEKKNNMPSTGEVTEAVLKTLRSASGRSPWGAIVFASRTGKWGMAWGQTSRRQAVVSALSSCGDARECMVELSFFGTECGAFAYSGSTWALVARENAMSAHRAALADCEKRGRGCRIVASVCANSSNRR